MASALEHAEKFCPRADGFAILMREDSRNLVQVGQVVNDPGGEKLRHGDGAERGMAAAPNEILRLKIDRAKLG